MSIPCQSSANPAPIWCLSNLSIWRQSGVNPIQIQCQSMTNLPIHNQSLYPTPILCQSANPPPICQSITNLPIHHQFANPSPIHVNLPILYQSWTIMSIHCHFPNPMPHGPYHNHQMAHLHTSISTNHKKLDCHQLAAHWHALTQIMPILGGQSRL